MARYAPGGGAPAEKPRVSDGDFLSFYGLTELPFADSVDPKYFFRTPSHDEAIVRLLLRQGKLCA